MNLRKTILIFLSAAVSLSACIKEDRSECPCRLVLDFSDVDTTVVKEADLSVTSEDGFTFAEAVDRSVFDGYMIKVPRSQIYLCAWAGAGYCLNEDMSVDIPYGEECPEVFLYVADVEADCELVEQKVRLCKNHCVLTISVGEEGIYPFEMTVRGNIDGYGTDLKPSVGDFACKAIPDTTGICSVVLPRQLDSSLILEIDDGTEYVKTFAIGKSIVDGGYDWDAEDLADVDIIVDYSLTEVSLEIIEWDKEFVYDVVI